MAAEELPGEEGQVGDVLDDGLGDAPARVADDDGVAELAEDLRPEDGAVQLTPLDAAPEPINLRRLEAAIRARWGVVPLMDMLAETAMRTGCLQALHPVGVQNHLDKRLALSAIDTPRPPAGS